MKGRIAVGVVIAAILAPVLLAPWRLVVGDPYVDAWGTWWFYWFTGKVMAGTQEFAHTDLLFYPWGKEIYLHTGGNLLDAVLAWPLFRVLPGPLAWNAWYAVILATNAWGGTRLAAALGVPEGRRWTAGLALVLNPYLLQELAFGRPTQALAVFAALAAAGLWSMRTARQAALAGLFLGLAAWTYWFHGMVLGALAVVYGTWRIVVGPERLRQVGCHGIAAAVCLAMVLPLAWPMVAAVEAGQVPGLLALDGTGMTAPLAMHTVEGDSEGLWVLTPLDGGAGSVFDVEGLRFNAGLPVLLWAHAFVALVGGIALARERGWRAAGWLPLWVAGALWLGAGPLLKIGGDWVRNEPWLAMVTHVDVLRRWWWPGRAVLMAHLALAPLVPFALGTRWPRLLGGGLVVGALVQLVSVDLLPLRSWDGSPSPVLTCLATAPAGAVIDVPWASDQKNLWFQTRHGHPILGGMLVRKAAFGPDELGVLRKTNTLLRVLEDLGERRFSTRLGWDEADRVALVGLGYRYVLARLDHFRRPSSERGVVTWVSDWSRAQRLLEKSLDRAPVAVDDQVALWTLDGSDPGCR